MSAPKHIDSLMEDAHVAAARLTSNQRSGVHSDRARLAFALGSAIVYTGLEIAAAIDRLTSTLEDR